MIVVIIIIVIGVSAYSYVASINSSKTSSSSSSKVVTTTPIPSSTLSLQSASRIYATIETSSFSSSLAIATYSGTFNFSLPVGPSGVRSASNGSAQYYNTIQVGSGSFTFFVSASNESGSGSGHGTLVATTSGFCSGRVKVPYTFSIPDASTLLGNLTIFFGTPTPNNITMPLSCTGPMTGVSTATNNPFTYLSAYPNEITVTSVPAVLNVHQTPGNFTYYFNIVKTS